MLVRGAVQGVGFRPTVYRLARDLGLGGWIRNSGAGVDMELEGAATLLEQFLQRLPEELPPLAAVRSLDTREVPLQGEAEFCIRASLNEAEPTVLVLPDLAPCPACLREVDDPKDRRYRYPFANCTLCGPRFSILRELPYDRAATTMAGFAMCPDCRSEYEDPRDRRFHAQPVACPRCGPRLALWDPQGRTRALTEEALRQAAEALRQGQILALKGLGGFQLLVDARYEAAVARLRQRKGRETKPLALMVPDLEWANRLCRVTSVEQGLLTSQAAPIVLMARGENCPVAPGVAPGMPRVGVMLPSTPLHYLLMQDLGFPVVATSGNFSDEPLCTDEQQALRRLGSLADLFLVHDRPIARPVDDSVVQVVAGAPQVLRCARGYAPLPLPLPVGKSASADILAVGGHMKGTVALTVGGEVVVSQHLGDLDTLPSRRNFQVTIDSLCRLYRFHPKQVACDLHPDYASTMHARNLGLPLVPVQHHEAHLYAGMLEAGLEPPVLGVSWDGTGFGPDGTVWGGEFFVVRAEGCRRVAHLRAFRLPGIAIAVREPRRAALGVLHVLDPRLGFAGVAPIESFEAQELIILRAMLGRGIHSPWTSSAGRLFEATAALLGLRQRNLFEGQAAMELEACLDGQLPSGQPIPLNLVEGDPLQLDWVPFMRHLLEGIRSGRPQALMAGDFHLAMAGAIRAVALRMGLPKVVLSGGCFQNRALTETTVSMLRQEGFQPFWHKVLPPNDGGLAAGQAYAALCRGAGA